MMKIVLSKQNLAGVSRAAGADEARIEIMGHRCHYGRTREEERFGSKMLRIDVPNKGDPATHGWSTLYYGGASIFSFALTDEASVMKANKPYVSAYTLTDQSDDEEL